MSDIFAVDVETATTVPGQPQFALEPYRLPKGQAVITELSVSGPAGYDKVISNPTPQEIKSMLFFLSGKVVYFHNGVFDIAWLYAVVQDITYFERITIRDTMLLAKWILNGQRMQFATKDDENVGYALGALVGRFLSHMDGSKEFIEMKKEEHVAGEDREYWQERALADTKWTRLLAIHLQSILPEGQRRGFQISMKSLPYVSRSWVEGVPFDSDKVNSLIPRVATAKKQLAKALGIDGTVISSPTQLGYMLFTQWGLEPISKSAKTGKGSTKADDLKMIALRAQGTSIGPKMKLIMDYKKLQTLESKYLNGFVRVKNYVGSAVCHGSPKMFGTYTGRYTYGSKTQRKQLFQNSIAMHQMPRKGPVKSCLITKEEEDIGKYDASGQEIAFMACASRDENMLAVLNNGLNIHSWMATNINGEDYNHFISRLKTDPDAYEDRQAAKLLNLSCQYRIGWKAIQEKFFGTYDKIITQQQAVRYLTLYKTTYYGVPKYWKSTCIEAQDKGYAETIGGRRYQLTDWNSHRWATESSAINFPVQGGGADQKDLVVWLVSEKFPELRFSVDVHDEGIFSLPKEHSEELNKDVVHFLNNIDYELYWDKEVPMPLTFEGNLGSNFKDCKEYAQPWNDLINMRRASGRRNIV